MKGSIRLKFDRDFPEPKIDKFIPEHSYHNDEDEQTDRNEIFEELKKWRENFEKYARFCDLFASSANSLPLLKLEFASLVSS